MTYLVVFGDRFRAPGPHYCKNDSAFRTIFREL
jgi:hypothetical protein